MFQSFDVNLSVLLDHDESIAAECCPPVAVGSGYNPFVFWLTQFDDVVPTSTTQFNILSN